MRVEATRPPGWFYIDWWLMNHCTWRCSYCADVLRNGSIATPDLKNCLTFLDSANSYSQSRGLRMALSFTGGELTEWAPLTQLLAHTANYDCKVSLRTNANLDAEPWQAIIEHVDNLSMQFHPEHTTTSRYMLNLARALDQGVGVRAVFNMLPQRFEELEDTIAKIQQRYPTVQIERRMLFEDPAVNRRPQVYTEQQQVKMVRQWGDIRVEHQGISAYTDYQTMVSEGSNVFTGMSCSAGLEQIIVDAWGTVFRGHCRHNGALGSLANGLRWPTEPVLCRQDSCRNAFDILATKVSVDPGP